MEVELDPKWFSRRIKANLNLLFEARKKRVLEHAKQILLNVYDVFQEYFKIQGIYIYFHKNKKYNDFILLLKNTLIDFDSKRFIVRNNLEQLLNY